MNSISSSLVLLLLGGALAAHAQAQMPAADTLLAQNTPITNTQPANNPIRRINPNSRQGTGASVPGARGPSTAPVPRTPSIENGEIGNGYLRPTPYGAAANPQTDSTVATAARQTSIEQGTVYVEKNPAGHLVCHFAAQYCLHGPC